MQLNNMISDKNTALILRLVLLCWIITKFICYPLWMGDRSFPRAPISNYLLNIPFYFHSILFWAGIGMMCLSVIYPRKKILLIFIGIELFSCLLDQNRWQPWEYQFLFMTAAYCAFNDKRQLYTAWQLMLVGLYFFSGLSKLHPAFIHDVWNSIVLRSWVGLKADHVLLSRLGYLVPLAELCAGILLLFNKLKRPAVYYLCAMHGIVLYIFSPLVLGTNEVIAPWNILMPVLLWLLFKKHSFEFDRIFLKKPFAWLIILCWCVLPWLHLANKWDNYLSFTLYSGGTPELYFCTDDVVVSQQYAAYKVRFRNDAIPCAIPISVYKWAAQTIHVPPYPQERVYIKFARQIQSQHPKAVINFYIYLSGFQPKATLVLP